MSYIYICTYMCIIATEFYQRRQRYPKHCMPVLTGHNEVVAKVMFLQVCVCPQGRRVSASVHAGIPAPPPPGTRQTPLGQADPPGPGRPPQDQADTPRDQADPPDQADPLDQADTPQDQADPPGPGRHTPLGPGRPPWTRQTPPWDQADTPPGTRQTPPPTGSRLQHTVYEWLVRILLVCILVFMYIYHCNICIRQ